jgi:MFS family permease
MTWPLLPNLRTAVAYPGDPFINTWILDWDWYATLHQPLHLFQANAFYPAKDSLAFSENLYGIALLLFPLRALGVDALTAHNLAILLGFAFSGFAAFLLGRMISGSALGGLAAGIVYAFVPFRFTQLPHVQHVFAGWLPMMLVALLHYARGPSWRRAALFGGAFLMNGLSNVHWFLFGSIVIALSIPIAVPRPRDWPRLIAATLIALALLLPFLIPYATVSKLYGMRRTPDEIWESSATLRDWLNPGVTNRLYRRFADTRINPERWIFPGALAIVLAAAGIVCGVRASRPHSPGVSPGDQLRSGETPDRCRRDARTPLLLALLWLAAGFVGSLGLHTFFYRLLLAYVPGFGAVRVPARWANIAYIGLAMLVAFAVAAIGRRWRWAAAAVAALLVIELRAAPIRWYIVPRDEPAVYRWLAPQDVRIIEVPFDDGEAEFGPMLSATLHHRPMANGASGFAPPEFLRLSSMWHAPEVGDDFVDELRRIHVDLVIARGDELLDRERRWLRRELERGRLSFVRRFDRGRRGDWVFSTRGGRGAIPEKFLRGEFTPNGNTFGALDSPLPGQTLTVGWFSGYAMSPHGVRAVNLLFNNGAIRIPAYLSPDAALSKAMPWYPVDKPRFARELRTRPPGVWPSMDVQVEIIDGRGGKTRLEDRWIEWK